MRSIFAYTAIRNSLAAKIPDSSKDWDKWSKQLWSVLVKILDSDMVVDPDGGETIVHIISIDKSRAIQKLKIDKCVMVDGCYVFFDDTRKNIIVVAWDSTDQHKLATKIEDHLTRIMNVDKCNP